MRGVSDVQRKTFTRGVLAEQARVTESARCTT